MTTNFENIEIADASATARKVAGQFVDQSGNDLFHQTAINVASRIEEATGVTIDSAAPTVITLNGLESHVLVDVGGELDHPMFFQLQYFTGGSWNAAPAQRLMNQDAVHGNRSYDANNQTEGRRYGADGTASANGGSHVFLIPTNGAVALRIDLYGSSVTQPGVSWARIVNNALPPSPLQTKAIKTFLRQGADISTPNTYTDGDVIGVPHAIRLFRPGSEGASPVLRSLQIGPRIDQLSPTVFTDIDVYILKSSEVFGTAEVDGDPFEADYRTRYFVGALQFRLAPTHGQYPLIALPGADTYMASADDLNIVLPGDGVGDYNSPYAELIIVARAAPTSTGVNGISVGYTLEMG